ncbi:eukaryotic translation initiation factor 2C [Pancytospora epiphaga]|nr:eukaryotic translation initiation factor 2C [Pancytospora epiphaga]
MSGYRGERRDTRGPPPRKPTVPSVTKPTPCNVVTNMYKYKGSNIILHAYKVTATPEIHRNNLFTRFMSIAKENGFNETFAFDGVSILVSPKKFGKVELKAPIHNGEQIIAVEYMNSYAMDDPNVDMSMLIQCVEVVTRFYQRQRFFVEKKKMISVDSHPVDLTPGIQVIPGLTTTFKSTRLGFCLNLDMVYGVFFKPGDLLDFIRDLMDKQGGGRYSSSLPECGSTFYNDFERCIKNIRLTTTHRERNPSFKVSGILNKAASSVEFEVDGEKMTVAAYFAKTYRPLKHPNLPLIVIKKRELTIYMPMEVCRILPSQKYPKKLDENMTSQLLKIAAQRPLERFRQIAEKAGELSTLQNGVLQEFGMAFDNSMLSCKGVILPPPKIVFSGNREVAVNNGSWNLIGVKATEGTTINKWKIFTFRSNSRVPSDTLRTFADIASKYGVSITPNPQTVSVAGVSEFFEAEKAPFNLIILPDKNSQRYEEVKRIAETYQSCFTQCILAKNVVKLSNPSFVGNLLLKINSKLGGKNWTITSGLFSDKPTILVGIDVTHPGLGELDSPSIVSVVASMDYKFVTYKTSIVQQERGQEIVSEMRSVMRNMLKSHYGATKVKPERVVVFRDGVGDSMFDAVFSAEIEAILGSCSDLSPSYRPELTFIVAQKRHSVRFSSNNSNLVPGTIVDGLGDPSSSGKTPASTMVSFSKCVYDFYLSSHNALQGTAHPVRYLVLLNESNFSASYLHEAVYGLCHLYMRATKSVSVVPPIYYAHLAAARGKCYLERSDDGSISMRRCDPSIEKNLYYL